MQEEACGLVLSLAPSLCSVQSLYGATLSFWVSLLSLRDLASGGGSWGGLGQVLLEPVEWRLSGLRVLFKPASFCLKEMVACFSWMGTALCEVSCLRALWL